MKKQSGPLFLFNVLVGYVCLQLCWWAYLLISQYNEIHLLRADDMGPESSALWLERKKMMIYGEGAVFLSLLLLGVYLIRKSFKKETRLAALQNNFLMSVTHELKSPLASIKLQMETLRKHNLEREKQIPLIESALEDSDRLNSLVENILLTTRLDNAAELLNIQSTDISTLANKTVASFITRFPNYTFKTVIDKDLFWNTDAMAFQSILINLVDNAVKYSKDSTTITIELRKETELILSVSDQGQGILPEDKRHIFEKFYRAGNEETRMTKGTGLGLYIVNNLVKSLKGNIEVLAGQGNTGTCFKIKFQQYP